MLLNYKSLHDGLNQAEINALYSILRKETIFVETLLMGTAGKYGVYNIVDTGIQVVNAIPTGQYTFNFSDGTIGVGVANDEGIVDVDISFDRSSVCDVVITFPPYVTPVVYNLSLTADKSIIQNDESVIVTALLTMDGSVCSGESLSYTVKHGSSVIDGGILTTDSSGQATISYTGTGVGDVTFTVEYGTLLQETYELIDATFYDKATSTDYNSNWINSNYTISRDTEGTMLTNNQSSGWVSCKTPTISFPTTGKTVIEFDIVDYNGNVFMQIVDSTAPHLDSNMYPSNHSFHVKFEISSSTIIQTVDGVTNTFTTSDYFDGTPFNVTFANNVNGRWLKYKNFVIYSISSDVHTYSLSVVSDKDIISYADGESATLTATLKDNDVVVSGETLNYVVKHGSTIIDSGSVVTGSDGTASISYTGTGIGDVSVEVGYSSLLQETYELEDCHLFDNGLTDKSSNYVKSTGMSMTHSTDHYILSNTIGDSFVNFIDGLDNVVFECDWSTQSDTYMNGLICSDRQLEFYNDVALVRGFDVGKGWCISIKYDDGRYTNLNETVVAYSKDTYNKLQMSINGDTIINKVYSSDGTELYSITVSKSVSNKYLSAFLGQVNATAYIKNIKVKAL